MHDGGSGVHFGIYKTLSKVKERFYWSESWCKKCVICAVAEARGPMQPHNVGSLFGRTAGEIASPLPVTEERNKGMKKVKDDGLQEKLPNVYETVRHKIPMGVTE